MRQSGTAWTALFLLALISPTFAAEQPPVSATGFAAEASSNVHRRTEEAFAALGYAPMPLKTPRLDNPDVIAPPAHNVMVFAGQYTTDNLGNTINPLIVNPEKQGIVAIAYGHDWYRWHGFVLGTEVGAGLRFGQGGSGELWGGFNIRHTGIVLFNTMRIGAGITVGLSAITQATGIEAEREIKDHGNATVLAYLGPEMTLAALNNPNWELVYRIQHRSGAYGVIAHFIEGANAHTLGLRYRF
jgi:hypothetical protein